VETRILFKIFTGAAIITLIAEIQTTAQDNRALTLENAVDLAMQNNHLLNVKKYQVEEKQQKVNEDKVKYYPVVAIGGSYQYNTNLPSITIEEGRFGALPFGGMYYPLPPVDEVIEVGRHNVYNAGVTVYQPITQIGKINAGVQVSKTDLLIAEAEESKAVLQVKQAVEKLYFGLLILQKQVEEAEIRVALAKTKLSDVENAVSAGKTTESNRYGLSASAAGEEQELLKLKIQYDDYSDDLKHITGLDPSGNLILEKDPPEILPAGFADADSSVNGATANNKDLRIASLYSDKADYSIKASKFSYLPDLGILGGYTYQEGTDIYPRNNAFIGASLKWNIQDAFLNRSIQRQRNFARKQAEENLANTMEQVTKDIEKASRKLKQSEALIRVAEKIVDYRREDLKLQIDRRNSGLNLESDLLAARAALAKAESDYFAARLNYRIALSELQILTGTY
jgi:outer membrane protein TolC